MFSGKTLLITGGTGTFGNAVLNRFLATDIKEIRVFSRDEKKQEDMRISLANAKLKFYIGDVRDPASIMAAMDGVDYVFQAAALKQVPSCEFYPLEAVKTNVLGTENVLNAATACGVEKVICLSTDKAVYPINAMGISEGDDGEADGGQVPLHRSGQDHPVLHPLRQRHGLARVGHPAVHQADQGRQAADGHRPQYDPVPDVDRRCRRSGPLRL